MPAPFVCKLRKSIVWTDTLRKEGRLEPLSVVLLRSSRPKKSLKEALPSEAAGPNGETMPLGNFEDQQQLKMRLRDINYAFMLLSRFLFFLGGENGVAVKFQIEQV